MLHSIVLFYVVAGVICGAQLVRGLERRDNTVYVTVTEYRYVPLLAPAPAPSQVAPHQSVPERLANNDPAPIHPFASSYALPIIATWQNPSDDALTFTSYAGLLNTIAPAFYPSPLEHATDSIVHPEPSTALQPMVATLTVAPIPKGTKPPPTLPAERSSVEPKALYPSADILPKVTPTRTDGQATTSTNAITSTNPAGASMTKSSTSSDVEDSSTESEETTSMSTDVTVSTTATTRGHTTRTTTSVGTDGTTTVMTEYPLATRTSDPKSTSGAQRVSSNQILPRSSFGSISEYIFDLSMATGVLIISGVTMLLI
ncbi:hypothetical protein BGZ80_011066 [Entomortierella chlamydospora]|uniref:Uncharacterized protein n=1 Tax=Entomortierella chlamydospora TaxID=101097 RepID=A0A9P6MU50_9FUNG|nr:hypothetical protein BGZ79_010624 [Entomortierella chlamydospora]KAG0013462.1 hypothetical protein BGZ80_011066 [Entomortierella chlamydospora]